MEANHPSQANDPSSSSGYYVWSPVDKNYTVYLNVAIIDRINFDVMRGFGAVPKRGAEVGGVLLGSVKTGDELVIRVDEFVTIPCEHLRGPSYILSENDLRAFDAELDRWSGQSGRQVVGFFRSNTREILQLGEEDLTLLNSRFQAETALCLLIKPYTTRPCEATFFVREGGAFPISSRYQTFTFRRKELGGGPSGPHRERGVPSSHRRHRDETASEPDRSASAAPEPAAPAPPVAAPAEPESAAQPDVQERPIERLADLPVSVDDALRAGRARRIERLRLSSAPAAPSGTASVDDVDALSLEESLAAARSRGAGRGAARRYRWVWLPLSLVFLLLGIVIGAEVTLTFQRSQNLAMNGDPYELDLTVSRFGSSFKLNWNPNLSALRQAKQAELYIEEGQLSKTKILSADELSHGSVIVPGAKENVRFRLTLFLRDHCTFSETVEATDATP
jgi:hypothetical protein